MTGTGTVFKASPEVVADGLGIPLARFESTISVLVAQGWLRRHGEDTWELTLPTGEDDA